MKKTFSTIGKIDEPTKIDRIVRELEQTIVEGNLLPGTELPAERALAEQLGVSRFSLREALRAAETRGLIEIQRGRKPRVARPSSSAAAGVISLALRRSKKTLLDLVAARQGLEVQIARVAAINASQRQIDELAATIETIKAHPAEPEIWLREDLRFHEILVEASGNLVFEIMLAPVTELLRESRLQTIARGGPARLVLGHEAVLDALRKREPELAAQSMHYHLEMVEQDILQIEQEAL
jgi:GntR family transcriptional repressor for pyruvate dehydrogenase complex